MKTPSQLFYCKYSKVDDTNSFYVVDNYFKCVQYDNGKCAINRRKCEVQRVKYVRSKDNDSR